MDDRPRRHHQLAVVGLRDLAVLPPHQDGGGHGGVVVRHLVQALAHRLHAVPNAADAAATAGPDQVVLA